jgi:hypothetical protein
MQAQAKAKKLLKKLCDVAWDFLARSFYPVGCMVVVFILIYMASTTFNTWGEQPAGSHALAVAIWSVGSALLIVAGALPALYRVADILLGEAEQDLTRVVTVTLAAGLAFTAFVATVLVLPLPLALVFGAGMLPVVVAYAREHLLVVRGIAGEWQAKKTKKAGVV